MSPVVTPSGRVVACCGVLSNTKSEHILVLGRFQSDTLESIYHNRARNPFVHALRIGGIVTLVQVLKSLNLPTPTPNWYDSESLCYSCFRLLAKLSSSNYRCLAPRPGLIARMAILRFVVFGETEGIDLLTPEEFAQASDQLVQIWTECISEESMPCESA